MKKLILLPLIVFLSSSVTAQWVEIPDGNFVEKLNQMYPGCMNGNLMNTQCWDIVNATGLSVSGAYINNLAGIEHFINLESLDCAFNNLTTLPELNPLLTTLDCSNNNLTSLPDLPPSLTMLNCDNNNISALPALPASLNQLYCGVNNLSELPDLPQSLAHLRCNNNLLSSLPELSPSLTHLWCYSNNLTTLPELPPALTALDCYHNDLLTLPELPQSLTHLICYNNDLTVLPELPQSLLYLRCHENNLIALPELPSSLLSLWCWNSSLNALPELPETLNSLRCHQNNLDVLPELPPSLTVLECWWNNLTAIPDLPQTLIELNCRTNDLTELPELPVTLTILKCNNNNLTALPELPATLTTLLCHGNDITCLPTLPMSLTNSNSSGFNIGNNAFTCLPNYVPAMSGGANAQWLSFPLCDLSDLDSNPYGCSSFGGVVGTVFNDNGNCEQEETESGVINATIKLLDQDDELLATTYTFTSGENVLYNLVADSGSYIVNLVTENMPFQAACDDPGDTQNVDLTTNAPSALNVDFGVECLPGFDIGIQSVLTTGWVFPGQVHTLRIAAGDMSSWYGLQCAEGVSGTVTVLVNGPLSYVGPANNALIPTVTGELEFTYDINDFSSVNFQEDFSLLLETNTTVMGGELVCIDIIVDPIDGDFNPDNNTYNHCYFVVNSYDPNIKEVWPHNVAPGYDDYFNYTIYFQNTGTAPAFNIRLADTLDTNLDLNTFEVTGYSHPVLTYLHGNVLTFRFNNIMLPDSTTDLEGSIGYVQYRIKPIADLPVGTVIENTAHIFFDFNEAIVTNTTQNEFVIITSANQPKQQLATVFPNPANGQFNVLFTHSYSGTTHMEVYNLSGPRVMQRQVNENQVVVDLTGFPSGMYLLHLRNDYGSEAVKLIKH
jgi:uncharacterized repeat protein (TIGR01451 family)